jgi:hypothetical protein
MFWTAAESLNNTEMKNAIRSWMALCRPASADFRRRGGREGQFTS